MFKSYLRKKIQSIELGFSQEELESEISNINNQIMNLIQKKNLTKVSNLLAMANKYLGRLNPQSAAYKRLKSITLNSLACYYHNKQLNREAIKIMDQAIKLEQNGQINNISVAHSYLNKCIILSDMQRHEQALQYANKAINFLEKQKKLIKMNKQRRQMLTETFVISFYNIAAEFEHLKNNEQAVQAYQKGYKISIQILGEHHKLTLLMKKNLRFVKTKSKINQKRYQDTHKTITQGSALKTEHYLATSSKIDSKNARMKLYKLKTIESKFQTTVPTEIQHESHLFPEGYNLIGDLVSRQNIEQYDEMADIQRIKRIYLPQQRLKNNSFLRSFKQVKDKSQKSLKSINSEAYDSSQIVQSKRFVLKNQNLKLSIQTDKTQQTRRKKSDQKKNSSQVKLEQRKPIQQTSQVVQNKLKPQIPTLPDIYTRKEEAPPKVEKTPQNESKCNLI